MPLAADMSCLYSPPLPLYKQAHAYFLFFSPVPALYEDPSAVQARNHLVLAHSCHEDPELFSVELITSIEEEYKDINEPHVRSVLAEPYNARSHAKRCELQILRSDLSAVLIGNAQNTSRPTQQLIVRQPL